MRGFRRRKTKREKAFRRGAIVQKIKSKPKRKERLPWFTKHGQHKPITKPLPKPMTRPIMVQRRKELTPMDLLKGAASQLGPFGANLAVGLQKTSTQVGPAVRQLSAMAKQAAPPLRGLGTKGLVPIGAGLRQIEQEILQQRPIGTPQIIDKQDVIPSKSENALKRYVKEAMRAMPVGTDTSIEPTVTVVPRDQFRAHLQATGAPHPNIPAMTTGKNQILVSDALFDMSEKERRAIMLHESYHAFRGHAELIGQDPRHREWTEKEAKDFGARLEPEGDRAAMLRLFGGSSNLRMGSMPPMMGR